MDDARSSGMLPTTPPAKPFHLHLVGRGDVKTLRIPTAMANLTTVHFNLKFPQYYDQIHHTHALLMLLGSNNYLLQKMSSTVVSSLMTGTPIIADAKVLKSYTFLKPEHVHLMGPGETEMDVMQRVLRMSPQEVFGVRQRVLDLAEHLNRRTLQVLQTFMPMDSDALQAQVKKHNGTAQHAQLMCGRCLRIICMQQHLRLAAHAQSNAWGRQHLSMLGAAVARQLLRATHLHWVSRQQQFVFQMGYHAPSADKVLLL
ncbi:hypothetical protein COO60DRAFT_767541 [Scenedesmus sp. NREL 46B-D3]|nr:hypothetical protein COO60DRAFT_767541 [Scenedesmus sp. NREL 46B-D3]